jgi:multidrug efflux system outer membrane protein
MMKKLATIFVVVMLGIFGCEVGPDYVAPKVNVSRDWAERNEAATTQSTTRMSRGEPIVQWWTTFHDPVLDELVSTAVKNNLDLKRAAVRVRETRAQRGVIRPGLYPEVNASGSYQHARVSKNGLASAFGQGSSGAVNAGGGGTNPGANGSPAIPGSALGEFDLYQVGFDASWEIDIFGGQRRAIEAASADIGAAVENQRDVLTTLLGEVARNYVEFRLGQHRLQIARRNLGVQQRTVELVNERIRQGLTNELDLARAQAEVATTTAQIPGLETGVSQAGHRLNVLLGDGPMALSGELAKESLPKAPDEVPVGLPSELLKRRADIRQAQWRIASATARVGAAVADQFPRFTINGSAGLQSLQAGDLVNWGSRYYSIGPGISWPVFDAGRTRNQVRVEQARVEQAVLMYRQVVLNALKDVEDALVGYRKARERMAALRESVAAEEKALRIARDLYIQGVTDFLSVLDAQRTLFAAEDALASGEGEVDTSLVALYKALGGGWELEEVRSGAVLPGSRGE